jgi:hypothetical protein
VEDVAEARRDECAQAVVDHHGDRMLARGTAAEVAIGHQDARAGVGRPVEREVGSRMPLGVAAQVVEQRAGLLGAGQPEEARRNDLVGVDVGQVQRHRDRGQRGERAHFRPLRPRGGARR